MTGHLRRTGGGGGGGRERWRLAACCREKADPGAGCESIGRRVAGGPFFSKFDSFGACATPPGAAVAEENIARGAGRGAWAWKARPAAPGGPRRPDRAGRTGEEAHRVEEGSDQNNGIRVLSGRKGWRPLAY